MTATPDPALVDTFRRIRQDARSDPKPTEVADPFTIPFIFDGAGQLPVVGDACIVPIGRITGRIVGASMVIDGAGSASVDLKLSNVGSWPNGVLVYDTTPSITGVAAAAVEILTTQWRVNLQPGDVLYANLRTATGSFTTLTLAIECIRFKWPSGSANVQDLTGNTVIDAANDIVTQRN